MKSFLIAALLALSSTAFAHNQEEPPAADPQTQGQTQLQGQAQGQLQGQGQSQDLTANTTNDLRQNTNANASAEANTTSVATSRSGDSHAQVGNTIAASGDSTSAVTFKQVKQVASANAAAVRATASCVTGMSLGGQTPVVGGSVSFTKRNSTCVKFELAQDAYDRGQYALGDRIYCSIKEIREAAGDLDTCLSLANQLIRTSTGDYVTRDEMRNALKAKTGVESSSK